MDPLGAVAGSLGVRLPSPLTPLSAPALESRGVTLMIKRDDLIHPDLPGNKWRKLKYTLGAAIEAGASTLLTFGGAYSNHIRAVAAAADHFGFEAIGIIRGEPHEPLNEVLSFAVRHGMRLDYLDRESYRHKTSPEVLAGLRKRHGDFFLIPEGGSSPLALRGCAELVAEIETPFDYICCPCGTGGTLAGIASGLDDGQHAIGFAALKGAEFLNNDVSNLQMDSLGKVTGNWSIEQRYHFGGFAKKNPDLIRFVEEFDREHGILLDWIYVAKMMYGVLQLTDEGRFTRGDQVVAVITG